MTVELIGPPKVRPLIDDNWIFKVETPWKRTVLATSNAKIGELLKMPTPAAVTLNVFMLPVPGVVDAFDPPAAEEYNQKSIALPKLPAALSM